MRYPKVNPPFDIRRTGHGRTIEEIDSRFWGLGPEKFEVTSGRLFLNDAQRLNVLGMLLEAMGIDAAIRMADPALWRAALDDWESERARQG